VITAEQEARHWARAAEVARTIIADILASGDQRVLNALSFSELHDYCDANLLGNQEEVLTECGWTGENDEIDGAALTRSAEILDRAQMIVDYWLKTRSRTPLAGFVSNRPQPKWLITPQIKFLTFTHSNL
jgi:hypothetical protein